MIELSCLIDAVEHYGGLVDAGEIDREDAAHRLAQFSDGGVTVTSARALLYDWRGARDRYVRLYQASRRAQELLADLEARGTS